MDCSKNEGAVAALPDDPLVEILSRVPAKSICRFKCVSKAWRDLIADPHHRKKLPQAMQGLFFMEEHMDHSNVSFSFIDLIARSVPLDIDPAFSFLTERPEFQKLALMDSCNGLVLFQNQQGPPYSRYIVCNPTTKRWEAVPTCSFLLGHFPVYLLTCAFLAFDPAISSHFHLVQFQIDVMDGEFVSLHAYSSETRTWSCNQIDSQEKKGPLEEWRHRATLPCGDLECVFVNGLMHFVVGDFDEPQIVAIDVQGKTRRIIKVPGVADKWHQYCYLGQSQGCLHYMSQDMAWDHEERDKLSMSVWVLEDYDTQEWGLKKTLRPQEIFGELSLKPWSFRVVGIHQDCNVVFLLQFLSGKLIAYDMDREEVSVISTFKDKRIYCFHRYVPCFSESLA